MTATAALLLTACGSGGSSSKDNNKIAGADTNGTKTSASPSPSSDDGAGRPKITLPGDVQDVFEGWKAGDPKTDPVLADAERRIDATNYALSQANPDEPSLGFYYTGDALVGAAQWVKQAKDAGVVLTGTTRYFNPRVNIYAANSATLSYCSFEGRAYEKSRKTGKINKDPVTNDSYLLYTTRLEKNDKGVWQTNALRSDRGNKACTP
ncbi:hypothetical protein M878_17770 [Streptomyces roseochromogenus subsp. oscitans DS 12.976]|uniref:Uncharacterized protein n=1 Tax=Streptomyces roseochromogenus subsp. oscitans DS 12.976 TaxID=1352936 RepID=V6KEI2_STRRC|nr:hypothetical protein M878_17770 [Streptomyces roseochromogenus subsp. oscitans DS 12.976]